MSGAISGLGCVHSQGRRDVAESTGIADVLSLEEVIATLIRKRNAEMDRSSKSNGAAAKSCSTSCRVPP